MENQTESAKIVKIYPNGVEVQLGNTTGCSSCSLSAICGKNNKSFFIATKKRFELGQQVEVDVAPTTRVLSSTIVFLLPVLIMIMFYFVSKIFFTESISVLISILSLPLTALFVRYLDKKLEDKMDIRII